MATRYDRVPAANPHEPPSAAAALAWTLGVIVMLMAVAALVLAIIAFVRTQELSETVAPPPPIVCNCSNSNATSGLQDPAHGNAVLYFSTQIVPERGRVVFDTADGAYQVQPYYYGDFLYGLIIPSNGTYAIDWSVMVATSNASVMARLDFAVYEGAVNDTTKEYNTILSSRRAQYVTALGSTLQLVGNTLSALLEGDILTLRNLSGGNVTVDNENQFVSPCAVGANLRAIKVSDFVPAELTFFTSS
jgi:hypothetical protein